MLFWFLAIALGVAGYFLSAKSGAVAPTTDLFTGKSPYRIAAWVVLGLALFFAHGCKIL